MTERIRHTVVAVLLALAAAVTLGAGAAGAASTIAPLPASDYAVKSVCATPAPGHAGCLSLELVPRTAEARAHAHPLGKAQVGTLVEKSPKEGGFGLRPADLHTGYELPLSPPVASPAQTIALVDAYNDPTAAQDLKSYEKEFGLAELPSCPLEGEAEAPCFEQVNQSGGRESLPFPATTGALEAAYAGSAEEKKRAEDAYGWGIEMSLDIETARATCQSCSIVLVEANSTSYSNFFVAEDTAAGASVGATEISNSWGGGELGEDSAFQHPGIVTTASAGDNGYRNWDSEGGQFVGYPASSPHVVSVGGTRLELEADGSWRKEAVWNGDGAGGGGCSESFTAPPWQQEVSDWSSVGCSSSRSVADVSAVADPYTGLAVLDSSPGDKSPQECKGTVANPHWCAIGGTSFASPLIAAVFALAGGAAGVEYPARTLYENEVKTPGALHDIASGSNGECTKGYSEATGIADCTEAKEAQASCGATASCLARSGYDGPTGVGTPKGIAAFEATGEDVSGKKGGEGEGPKQAPPAPPVSTPVPLNPLPPVPVPLPPLPEVKPTILQLSGLALTLKAIVTLNSSHPKLSQVAFAFTINAGAAVRETLARRVRVHRRLVWLTVGRPVTRFASAGRNSWRLRGSASLRRGAYRLTLAPAHAPARSLTFQIG